MGKISNVHEEKPNLMVLKAAFILVVGSLAPLLDSTMLNVAIKTIASDMDSTLSVIQWVITGYILTMAITVPVSGWAVNRFGCKKMYLFSLIVFLAGSALSGIAWNIESLIFFRILQGIGAGLMMPTVQTMLVYIAGTRNLGRVMSIISIPALLGPIFGPVIGGLLVDSLSWRWIFYVNIPVTIIAILLAMWGLPKDAPSSKKQSLDIIGIMLLSPAFALLILGISNIRSSGSIGSSVLIPILIGSVAMILFIVRSLYKKGPSVIDLRLFKSRNFSVSNALLFLSGFILNGGLLLFPLYFQQVQGESALYTSLFLIPQGVGILLTRSWVGQAIDRDRSKSRIIIIFSLLAIVLGTLPFAFAGINTNHILLAAALLIRGAGIGGLLIPIMALAYVELSRDQVPDASTTTRILQTIGGAFGTAILATVINQMLLDYVISDGPAFTIAYNAAFWWLIGFTVLAVITAPLLPQKKKIENKASS